jgi:hypothetical protein
MKVVCDNNVVAGAQFMLCVCVCLCLLNVHKQRQQGKATNSTCKWQNIAFMMMMKQALKIKLSYVILFISPHIERARARWNDMEGTKFFVSSILFADETNTIWIKIARECF